MSIISKNLAFLRKKNKLTQAEISRSIDVPQSTYASWEYDKAEPNVAAIIQICEIFGVNINDFLKKNIKTGEPELHSGTVNDPVSLYSAKPKKNQKTEDKDALIAAQQITIEALRHALSLAQEQISFLKKSPF